MWSKGANLTTIAVASAVRRTRRWCKFERRFLQQTRLMNMHPGRGAERMVFILDTEYLRRYFNGLSFHHLVWSLERTNSSFRSSSFRSIEGSGREGDRSPQGDAKKGATGFATAGKCIARCNRSYYGICQRDDLLRVLRRELPEEDVKNGATGFAAGKM